MKTRQATVKDFKEGTILITSEGYEFRILNESNVKEVWNARGRLGQGDKLIFESEAKFYQVKE